MTLDVKTDRDKINNSRADFVCGPKSPPAPAPKVQAPPPPAGWDLKVEYRGEAVWNQDVRVYVFRVTNVGDDVASATTATVETVVRGPTNRLTFPIPALPPYTSHELSYYLAGECDGTVVKVTVPLERDANMDDNALEQQVCALRPPPADTTPAHLRPGTHTITLQPSADPWAYRANNPVREPKDLLVGWHQREALPSEILDEAPDHWEVWQTAVQFDLGRLDQIPRKFVERALLTFDEEPYHWTDYRGERRYFAGCVEVFGLATTDWANQGIGDLFPNDDYDAVYNINEPRRPRREWDVTGHVRRQMQFPDDAGLRYSYVLRGALEQLEGTDSTSCLSEVSEIKLYLTYVIGDY